MAYITREYDNHDLRQRIEERVPGLKLGDNGYLEDADINEINGQLTLTVTIEVAISKDDADAILANPR